MKKWSILVVLLLLVSCSTSDRTILGGQKESLEKQNSGATQSIPLGDQKVGKSTGQILSGTVQQVPLDTSSSGEGEAIVDGEIDKLAKVIEAGKIDDAEKAALELYKKYPNSAILLNLLGNIYNRKSQPKVAIEYLEKANKLSGEKDGNILINLGVCYRDIDKEKALKYLQEAEKILPNDENLKRIMSEMKK